MQIDVLQKWGRGEECEGENGMAEKSFLQRLKVFYTSPAVKHYIYFVSLF